MAEIIQEFTFEVTDASGVSWRVRAGTEPRGHIWIGWLEFLPQDRSGRMLKTGEETSQPTRDAVRYWASGLERVYLEGALSRAS